jgi:hypothetical protein
MNIEEIDVEDWKTDLAFLVLVTYHLNSFNKEPHGKYKLITEMYCNIKTSKDKPPLWKNEGKLHNLVHLPHLKTLDASYPHPTHSQSILLLQEENEDRWQKFEIAEP